MHIIIVYGSLEGQTRKIAQRIAELVEHKGHEATTLAVDQAPADIDLDEYDAAIIGGPIHIGKYPKPLVKFITTHREWLNGVPGALFTVCMAINSKLSQSREQAGRFGDELLTRTGWRPMLNETFAGAVKYTQYGFITRLIMKRISKHEGGSTDTSRDHEYTDWDRVAHFVEQFVAILATQQESRHMGVEVDS